ncbi:response regulator [Luteimonas sp. RD2P54]|uniref:Response regulator n=1 Tax=Luteimonas endophytica TaxID=3042023 RepID=A0ABT6J7R1_9GAMM|nr:response regulator [Luteimonas endophytica]MDH5822866.1 response regulator [Luteimonas endophytica]
MVDDDRNILDTVVEALRDLDYAVTTAENGHDALERLRNDPGIAILFTDVVMPGGMTGIELARKARELRPALAIVLASGYSESWLEELPEDCDYLPKPYRVAELATKLGAAAGRSGRR